MDRGCRHSASAGQCATRPGSRIGNALRSTKLVSCEPSIQAALTGDSMAARPCGSTDPNRAARAVVRWRRERFTDRRRPCQLRGSTAAAGARLGSDSQASDTELKRLRVVRARVGSWFTRDRE